MHTTRLMPKEGFSRWIDRLVRQDFNVVAPVEKHGQYVFDTVR